MDGIILLKEFDHFEEHINGLRTPDYAYNDYDEEVTSDEREDMEVELEDLHHSIDIKEEDDPILDYQLDSNEETPYPANSTVQIKIEEEEIELNLEDLHHTIDIKEDTSVVESQSNRECKSQRSEKKPVRKSIKFETGNGKKIFSCDVCGYKCNHKGSFKRHLFTHKGEKRFACTICDYKCLYKHTLKMHLLTHTGEKPFACEICDRKFSRRGNLKVHLTNHTGLKPFVCEICDFKCNLKNSLKMHILTHSGEKPFACEICDRKFTRKGNLKVHITKHTGPKTIYLVKESIVIE